MNEYIFLEATELCPHCEHEVELKVEFKPQICPNCNVVILPCSICENQDCNNCPLEEEKIKMNAIL